MTTSISRPGVEIAQEFVTTSPTVSTPSLVPIIIGPCFRVIDAFDDDGDPQTEAYAGTYQDGYGTVSYDLPSIGDEDSLSTLDDEIRVFLLLGTDSTELNSSDDEVTLASGTAVAGYDQSESTFTDTGAIFQQLGVESGDVVRITWRDQEVDIPITVDAASDIQLTVDNTLVAEDMANIAYEVIRNPAEFVYDAESQAFYIIGDEDDYLQISATALKLDGETVADYAGSAGDDLTVSIVETAEVSSGTLTGFVGGDEIFYAADENFTTSIPATASVPNTTTYIVIGTPADEALREVTYVINDDYLYIETGEGVKTSQNWIVGTEAATGSDGATAGGDETDFTSASASFDTTIPNTGGTPDTTTYIELSSGVFQVTTVTDDNTLVISAGAGTGLSGESYTVITQSDTGTVTGNVRNPTSSYLVDPSATFSADGVSTSHSVDVADTAYAVSSVTSEVEVVMAVATDAQLTSYEIVETTSLIAITWDATAEEVQIVLARTAGVSGNTYAEIVAAITDDEDASYNETVAEFLTAALGGDTGTGLIEMTDADLESFSLDGGADDDQLILDADLIGSEVPVGQIYVSYRALRLDVSASAEEPSLSTYESTSDMQDALGDSTTDNPLSLGMYFALLNAPSQEVSGLGIDEISATKPNGTLDAYNEALEFLEGQEVYAMVPLTQDPTIHAVFETHVDSMSESDNKGERILLFNQDFPAYASATTVTSGTSGNTGEVVDEDPGDFTTSVNLTEAGVDDSGMYLVVTSLATSDESPDLVQGTQGLYGVIIDAVDAGDDFTLNIDFTDRTVEDDGQAFAWDEADWDSLVDVSWAIYTAGSAITAKSDQRNAIAEIGEAFLNRRCFHVWPSDVIATVDSTSTVLDGFYLACAVAGWIAKKNPSQGMTNDTVTGFTGLRYSNNYFSDSQLDYIAGGGTMIFIQESSGASLKCRHQLSTNPSTVQLRELSITKAIDYVAKFLRGALSSQIGAFNITQSFLDSLAIRVQGLGRYLVSAGVLNGFSTTSIEVDSTDPSQVNIVCALDVLYPCNTIYLTLQV